MGSNLYLSASSAIARLNDLEVIANNLANADTAGFKRDDPIFESVLEAALRKPDGDLTGGAPGQAYVDTQAVATDHSAGSVSVTGAPLDVAIDGPGFFEIQTPEGLRYTRAGSFLITKDKQIATPNGYPVLGDGGPLTVGDRPASFQPSGDLVDDAGSVLGRLKIVEFNEVQMLQKEGLNLFDAPPEAGLVPAPEVGVMPGSVERSNVVPVSEMAAMMIVQRMFDVAMQSVKQDDDTTGQLLREFLG